jgi:hypothetical protein
MLPSIDRITWASAASTTTGSNTVVVSYVDEVAQLGTPGARNYATRALTEYRELQDSHERPQQIRTLLEKYFPLAVPKFDAARDAYQKYKAGHAAEPAAAIEMRTFLDELKGRLLESARRHSNENITIDKAIDRLFSNVPTKTDVEHEFACRESLIGALSTVAKRRPSPSTYNLDVQWARVLDHAFIVCNAMSIASE